MGSREARASRMVAEICATTRQKADGGSLNSGRAEKHQGGDVKKGGAFQQRPFSPGGPKIKAATQKLRKFIFGAFKALGKKTSKGVDLKAELYGVRDPREVFSFPVSFSAPKPKESGEKGGILQQGQGAAFALYISSDPSTYTIWVCQATKEKEPHSQLSSVGIILTHHKYLTMASMYRTSCTIAINDALEHVEGANLRERGTECFAPVGTFMG
ncbi:hypothetical protein B0H13DRAFT_1864349 [Mycena leptocephala]|nr:hypothetical protein B0H13DRAFT_1864349 [Mycena leptocephala]